MYTVIYHDTCVPFKAYILLYIIYSYRKYDIETGFLDFIRRVGYPRLRPGLQLPTAKLIKLEPSCQARKDIEG